MSNDRELLELAAKAIGWKLTPDELYPDGATDEGGYFAGNWNPLTDDGDALRLAVELGMGLVVCNDTHRSAANVDEGDYEVESHDTDPNAATRRAIVRAAAEIGKAM